MDKIKIDLSYKGSWFLNLLALTFVILKVTGVVTWSWALVLSPLAFTGVLYILNLILTVFILAVISITHKVLSVELWKEDKK